MTYQDTSIEEAAAKANARILWPAPNELFVDIDDEESLEVFDEHFTVLCQMFPTATVEIRPSRRRAEGRHIVVRMPYDLGPEERLLLQALLGSDRKRELLGLLKLRRGAAPTTCFFEAIPEAVPEDGL